MKKITSSSLISSLGGFDNERNNDTNFDNASDFMMVMRPERASFRFDYCLNMASTLFKIYIELKSHISQTLVVKVTRSILTGP